MKNKQKISLFIITIILFIFNATTSAQSNDKNLIAIKKKDLVGVWQKDYPTKGNGLLQNFHFFEDGRFVLDMSGNYDDARSLIKLKGKYRIGKDGIYFTIISKVINEGKIQLADPGVNYGIFVFDGAKIKEIKENHPQEISDPCFVTILSNNKIKLNTEIYYKISY